MRSVRQARRCGALLAVLVVAVGGVGCDDGESAQPRRSWRTFERLPPWRGDQTFDYFSLAGDTVLAHGGATYDGGVETVNRGAPTFRVGDKRWKRSRPPFSGPLFWPGAVWTGSRLVVTGEPCPGRFRTSSEDTSTISCDAALEAATFDPAQEEWARVAAPEAVDRAMSSNVVMRDIGSSDGRVVFWFLANSDGPELAAEFDPARDHWTVLGGPTEGATICRSGEAVLKVRLVEGPYPPNPAPGYPAPVRSFTAVTERWQRGTERWREVDRVSFTTDWSGDSRTQCEGSETVIATWGPPQTTLRWFDAGAGGWDVQTMPGRFVNYFMARIGGARVVWPSDGEDTYFLLPKGSREWQVVPKPSSDWLITDSSPDRLLLETWEIGTGPRLAVFDPVAWAREHA
jgi:hypothetical protein